MNTKQKPTRDQIHRKQIRKIIKYKKIMSEKAGKDLGDRAVMEWIDKFAARFRNYWEKRLKEKENDEEDC